MASAAALMQPPLVGTVPWKALAARPCQSPTRPGMGCRSPLTPCSPPAMPRKVWAASRTVSGSPSGTVIPANDSAIGSARRGSRISSTYSVDVRGGDQVRAEAVDGLGGHRQRCLPALDGAGHGLLQGGLSRSRRRVPGCGETARELGDVVCDTGLAGAGAAQGFRVGLPCACRRITPASGLQHRQVEIAKRWSTCRQVAPGNLAACSKPPPPPITPPSCPGA